MDVGAGRLVGAVVSPVGQRCLLPVGGGNGVVLMHHRVGADAELEAARGVVKKPVGLLAELELVDFLRARVRVADQLAFGRVRVAQHDDAHGALEEVRSAQHRRAERAGRVGGRRFQVAPDGGGQFFQIGGGETHARGFSHGARKKEILDAMDPRRRAKLKQALGPSACNVSARPRAESCSASRSLNHPMFRPAQLLFLALALSASAAPSFREDVIPLLTRAGCNMGACHGKLAGQNGFRLSLRGYAPEIDHRWLTREFAGRRVDTAQPAKSLLLLKPTGTIAPGRTIILSLAEDPVARVMRGRSLGTGS